MLLSVPTWLIHLLTVSEWLAAILLIHRYAVRIGRPRLRLFAYAMIPHLCAGLLVLSFHASGDRTTWLLDASRLMTFLGSLSLLAATLLMLRTRRLNASWLAGVLVAVGLSWGLTRLLIAGGVSALLPGANLMYLGFLSLLLVVARQDRALFSPISIAGFWFLLVFVAGTITATHIATARLGLPSLSHADLLHGASESLLSVSNFLIALGAYRRLRAARGNCTDSVPSRPVSLR
ncbi:MAG: DUF2499 domain-containing protein [Thiohalocapsa sp.]|jgi:hypothetical protein|uniref:DUF2499 domain-containing protein n=1 Tax=Thiohalocapsa sp. TaxID=2497641 RepID=UPI0025CD48EC|nr:DUF2499 domain-containing protein [Thiohalocapsa sp.]MCG6943586.1 DUF2499 domain-containing protein [Thiohalocapsa sp.]